MDWVDAACAAVLVGLAGLMFNSSDVSQWVYQNTGDVNIAYVVQLGIVVLWVIGSISIAWKLASRDRGTGEN